MCNDLFRFITRVYQYYLPILVCMFDEEIQKAFGCFYWVKMVKMNHIFGLYGYDRNVK